MNSFEIMDALGGLPERYYIRALPRNTAQKETAVIPAPRFLTAAAAAACTVFAVSVGAFLIRRQQEEMILQSAQADSAVQEMTAAVRDSAETTAAVLTEPVQTQTAAAAESVQNVTATESAQAAAGEPVQTAADTDVPVRIRVTDRTEPQEGETETSAETTESAPETACTAYDGIAQIDLSGDAVCEWTSAAPPQYKVTIPEQGGTVFTWDTEQNMIAASCGEKTVIVSTEIRNVFFSDLNNDGIPELCVGFTTSAQDTKGHLASDRFDKIVIYNPVSQKLYEPEATIGVSLMDGVHDYRLYAENGNLIAERTSHPSAIFSNLPVTVTGRISLENDKLIFTETE